MASCMRRPEGASNVLPRSFFSMHFIFVRTKDDGGVLSDEICFVSLEQRLIEAMPAQRAARLDDFLKSTVLAFAVKQRFTRAQAAAHDLSDEQAATTDFAEKPLAYDVTNCLGQTLTQLLLFVCAKHSKNTADSLSGVDGVKRGVDDMAGL